MWYVAYNMTKFVMITLVWASAQAKVKFIQNTKILNSHIWLGYVVALHYKAFWK